MKWFEVRGSKEEANAIEEILVSTKLPYNKGSVETETGPAVLYSVPVPDQMVDNVMANFQNRINLKKGTSMIIVAEISASVSPTLDRIKERVQSEHPPASPLEAIIQRVDRYLRPSRELIVMILLATVTALAGLFLNNLSIVIGAMLLSPLLGPINAVAVNASLGKVKQMLRGESVVLGLTALAIVAGALVTASVKSLVGLQLTSDILVRSHVSLLDVMVALILGIAAGLAMVTEFPEILVGVAVAAALVPPIAVTGIGLAFGEASLFFGALLVVLTNLFGLKVGGIVVLLLKGVSPRRYYEKKKARRYSALSFSTFVVILILLALFILFVPKR